MDGTTTRPPATDRPPWINANTTPTPPQVLDHPIEPPEFDEAHLIADYETEVFRFELDECERLGTLERIRVHVLTSSAEARPFQGRADVITTVAPPRAYPFVWRDWCRQLTRAWWVMLPEGREWEELRRQLRMHDVCVPPSEAEIERTYGPGPLGFVSGAGVSDGATAWVFDAFISTPGLTVVTSYPSGLGVSALLRDWTARFTVGGLPGHFADDFHDVVLVSRDGTSTVDVPRLRVAGAALDRVHFADRTLATRADVAALEEFAYERGAELVVIDALDDRAARRLLDPLAEMANDTGRAVLVVVRGSKNERATSAVERIAGSGALADAAASVLAVINDQYSTDERDRVLFVAKSRYGSTSTPGLCFRVDGYPSAVTWLGTRPVSRRDALARVSKMDRAYAWAAEYLLSRPGHAVTPAEFYRDGSTVGFGRYVLDSTATALGVQVEYEPHFRGARRWVLPDRLAKPLAEIVRIPPRAGKRGVGTVPEGRLPAGERADGPAGKLGIDGRNVIDMQLPDTSSAPSSAVERVPQGQSTPLFPVRGASTPTGQPTMGYARASDVRRDSSAPM